MDGIIRINELRERIDFCPKCNWNYNVLDQMLKGNGAPYYPKDDLFRENPNPLILTCPVCGEKIHVTE